MTTETSAPAEVEPRARHSWGEVVQYLDGHAFGIDAKGKTLYLGIENEIRAAITAPDLGGNLTPEVLAIVRLEARLIKERKESERDGRPTDRELRHHTSEIRRRGNQRARSLRPARRGRLNGRRASAR